MIMNDAVAESIRIMDKAESSDYPIAVFINRGRIKVSRFGLEAFHEVYRKAPQSLLAVYDHNVMREWIEEDLRYVGVV
jgi:hypothetical protein